jgi:hypothetical protein
MKVSELRLIADDWRKVYRYTGGLPALAACIGGTRALQRGMRTLDGHAPPGAECVTFSVVPKLSALWSTLIATAIPVRPLSVLLGDCSGSLAKYLPADSVLQTLPLLNYHHGEKLDLFVQSVCRAEYVVVSDDDIFWLGAAPWEWARAELDADPKLAAVSLLPFKHMPSPLAGKVPQPMGSCFVIRRSTWLAEGLSFRVDTSPLKEGKWIYDTGAKAQVQLWERGYRIGYAPEEIQACLLGFEGISSWALKIQKHRGRIGGNIGVAGRAEKALQTILALRGLAGLFAAMFRAQPNPHLVPPALLDEAERVCRGALEDGAAAQVAAAVDAKLARLRAALLPHA